MNVAHLVPQVALARVVTAGGPYRPGDDLSLAFNTPTVSRLVAHDAQLRAKCVPLELALVPETIVVVITHCAAPYRSGEILTLSFVDPRVARIHESLEGLTRGVVAGSTSEAIALGLAAGERPVERLAQSATVQPNKSPAAHVEAVSGEHRSESQSGAPGLASTPGEQKGTSSRSPAKRTETRTAGRFGVEPEATTNRDEQQVTSPLASLANLTAEIGTGEHFGAETSAATRRDGRLGTSLASLAKFTAEIGTDKKAGAETLAATRRDEQQGTSVLSLGDSTAEIRTGEIFGAETLAATSTPASGISHSGTPLKVDDLGVFHSSNGAVPVQIGAGEPMTLRDHARFKDGATGDSIECNSAGDDASMQDLDPTSGRSGIVNDGAHRAPSPRTHGPANERVTVRLEWKSERLRRFVQVVDKLFTIDRLGWYRHSLAMRLLIPDEISCGDMLANVEAMRHLQALRAAAVESLGKPLLAACMPGFSISSDWLDSIESAREARAIAGLRDALLPYAAEGEEASDIPSGEALYTTGTISRTELLAENATSVEAFLPLLIPTTAHDAVLGVRLAEYRRLLIDLFAQTARAGEPVRLQQMAQPNHSLDDRLWQLVGAAAEAFGGFAHA